MVCLIGKSVLFGMDSIMPYGVDGEGRVDGNGRRMLWQYLSGKYSHSATVDPQLKPDHFPEDIYWVFGISVLSEFL